MGYPNTISGNLENIWLHNPLTTLSNQDVKCWQSEMSLFDVNFSMELFVVNIFEMCLSICLCVLYKVHFDTEPLSLSLFSLGDTGHILMLIDYIH